jgi:cyclase
MIKTRLITVLFLMNGLIVRSEGFRQFKVIGNPINELRRYSEWQVDELAYIDITRAGGHDQRRDDHAVRTGGGTVDILREISRSSFMPLLFGGRITSLAEVDQLFQNGADKVLINSSAYRSPALITTVAEKYGRQAMVVGIDVKREGTTAAVYIDQGRTRLDVGLAEWAREVERLGAGEVFLNSIDRDGAATGFDVEAIRQVVGAVDIPVIACGGAGTFEDFLVAARDAGASAVAAGNIFHFTEHAYPRAKRFLRDRGVNVRYPFALPTEGESGNGHSRTGASR